MSDNNKTMSRKEILIFLAVAFGVPYLMGLPMYWGHSSGADVSVFPLAQMLYPAAGVMLAFLITRRHDPMLPRGFYGFYLVVTAVMLGCSLASVALKEMGWLIISNYVIMAASVIGWIVLLSTKRESAVLTALVGRRGAPRVFFSAV